MKMGVYTIYDRLAEQSGPLFEAPNSAVANRQYKNLVMSSKVSPDEYRVLHIGDIDHDTSIITAYAVPEDVTIEVVL